MPEDPPAAGEASPLASAPDVEEGDDEPTETVPVAATAPAAPAPPPFEFKPMTAFLTFLFVLGLMMIVFQSVRNGVAGSVIGVAFWPLFGFSGHYPFLTMAIAGILEMLATALAYNWATDWVKAAQVARWGAAFRKVQMAALRSGKKDRIAALTEKQNELTKLTTDVNLAQMKGLAVTWFLVIAIYTWVFLFLNGCAAGNGSGCTTGPAAVHTITVAGSTLNLTGSIWIVPAWFLIFTFYTVPFSLLFRRILKHYSLRQYGASSAPATPAKPGASGGAA